MKINQLFVNDVTRKIPPVVYFHDTTQERILSEVNEYIITGGQPVDHPEYDRHSIHEQLVLLLTAINGALDIPGGPTLPTCWISGFYGSGKSSFAKLLGLALNREGLPDGRSMGAALLDRDTSPRKPVLEAAWNTLLEKINPIATIFDVGSDAKNGEHIHAAVIRNVQKRLGYCHTRPAVADAEISLEADGHWEKFITLAEETLNIPWSQAKEEQRAHRNFSVVMNKLDPTAYPEPMAWFMAHGGKHQKNHSPEDAVKLIEIMLTHRSPDSHLFIVIDEVSQYVLASKDRVDRLRAFATALGGRLKGKVWLMALGQQKLDQEADNSFLTWAKDRFPPEQRVHLAATNIRDVVHKRLLEKNSKGRETLSELFSAHRADLKMFAYGCNEATPEQFIRAYPLLPKQMNLILEITSALRTRSARAQGDAHNIRGLLQILGDLFRGHKLAEKDVGALITMENLYDLQETALNQETTESMERIAVKCEGEQGAFMLSVAKAVAMLELIQEHTPTTAELVAKGLFDRIDRGDNTERVKSALKELREDNLVGYTNKHGYKLHSSSAEEWARERDGANVPRAAISKELQDTIKYLMANPERPKLMGRPFPWTVLFSDGHRADDVYLNSNRGSADIRVDFREVTLAERTEATWINRSLDQLKDRLVWLSSDTTELKNKLRTYLRSKTMVDRYLPQSGGLQNNKKVLLIQEQTRSSQLREALVKLTSQTWMSGKLYFNGLKITPSERGVNFDSAIKQIAEDSLPTIYSRFSQLQILPSEIEQLLKKEEIAGPSPKFLSGALGLLSREVDGGGYTPTCGGAIPTGILAEIEHEQGMSGDALLGHFTSAPYGYTSNLIKAVTAAMIRGEHITITNEAGHSLTTVIDAGVKELFNQDRAFRASTIFPNDGIVDVTLIDKTAIRRFFSQNVGVKVSREAHAIADAVAVHFPQLSTDLDLVANHITGLPTNTTIPKTLSLYKEALVRCNKSCRQTTELLKILKFNLDSLRDGHDLQKRITAELTLDARRTIGNAANVLNNQLSQLEAEGPLPTNLVPAKLAITEQLTRPEPWQQIISVSDDTQQILDAYKEIRQAKLNEQERLCTEARQTIKRRPGFSKLTGEQSNHVLSPILQAKDDTSADAIAPSLTALTDTFRARLQRKIDEANTRLDDILGESTPVLRCDLSTTLQNREISSESEVDKLVEEIRTRLISTLNQASGEGRVRITWGSKRR
jgi:hypothetical protein